MIFKNSHWKREQIGFFVDELKETIPNPVEAGYTKYVGFEHIEPENLYLSELGDLGDGVRFIKKFKKGDILFGKIRAYLKKVAIAPLDGVCSGDILVLRTKNEKIVDQGLLPYFLITQSFLKLAIDSSNGTTLPRTKWQHLSKHLIPLPSLEEQKQIVSLFQAIEIAIREVEEQGKRLKSLRKSLINKLTRKNIKFGNLINMDNCKEYFVGDIAAEIRDRTNKPSTSGFKKFIGLDDFESGELTVRKHSSPEKLISAAKICKKDNVLLASRNAYLKRASLTEFDAICSGDVIVIKADEKIILSKFLVLIMNTNEFWDYAIANAKGSMSKRVKWRELVSYSLDLPDIKTQKKILAVLQNVESTRILLDVQKSNLKKLKQQLLNEILG